MKTTKFYDPETEKMIDYPITDEAYEYYKENIGDPSEMGFWRRKSCNYFGSSRKFCYKTNDE